jgi:carbon starvation protein
MKIYEIVIILFLLPILVFGGVAAAGITMNALIVIAVGVVETYLGYKFYARYVDRNVIGSDAKKTTPAKLYMDGVDFMPTSRGVLYGYHFKSIAAAGPIVGVIAAANLWGWLPALLWLALGVTFIGWASDYSAIIMSVRNEGHSLSAIAYRLIAPRTRTILFVFIFFYLLLLAAAFVGIMTALMSAHPDVPFGIIILTLMALLAGQMLYRWKLDLIAVSVITVVLTLGAMTLGPFGISKTPEGTVVKGPVERAVISFNNTVDGVTGGKAVMEVVDPTLADPRIPPPGADGKRPATAVFDAEHGAIRTMPSFIFWALFIFGFSYLGATLPIWRFAQPVNYIGFWITLLVIGLSFIGAVVAALVSPSTVAFIIPAIKIPDLGFGLAAGKAWQPLWPMLFVTIACGSISGWHSLVGATNTSRQLEYETDALPVGGGGMFSENWLALLSLIAVAIAGGGGAGAFASGIGKLLGVLFGSGFALYGTALGFGAFMVIVLTVTQLVFRVMRVTLTEWIGDPMPVFRNIHVTSIFSMILTAFLLLSGTWVYLWQLFGASNQLMAALSMLIVTVWLRSVEKSTAYILVPMLFMLVTTMVSILVTAHNLYVSVLMAPAFAGGTVVQIGGWLMLILSALLFIAALLISVDAYKAWQKYAGTMHASMQPIVT